MYGTWIGNVIAVCYFLAFQACGLLLGRVLLRREGPFARILGGSVLGSVLLQWTPVLFAFFLDFTVQAHLLALLLTAAVSCGVYWRWGRGEVLRSSGERLSLAYGALPLVLFGLFCWLVLSGFTFRDGRVYSSQATYGDMSMHLGFMTSIATQQSFPPEYSILPGTRLSYPFLSDSISSSLYVFGSGIRLSYCLPMFFAGAQVMAGAWLFLRTWLEKKGRTLFAWTLFFLNGGLGFMYLFGTEGGFGAALRNTFTAFYETPTNFVEHNIRWVNTIVDMLVPQRATLFGYAVLFFSLYLLYRAVWQQEHRLFPVVGLFAGALPMIHTHSFLALGLISGCWLIMDLVQKCEVPHSTRFLKWLLVGLIGFMQLLQWVILPINGRESWDLVVILGIFALIFLGTLAALLRTYTAADGWKILRETWGRYLLMASLLAVPQLLIWTFGQATGDGFFRGYFNWANIDNNYLWFYLKNMGLALVLFLLGYLTLERRFVLVGFPVLIIWLIAELVVFQPNVYDNNKLLYVAYLLMCGIGAEFAARVYARIRSRVLRLSLTGLVCFLCTISAVLTLGRELNAEYELFGENQMELAEYVVAETEPDALILTDTRHNNAIAALTGRNILCGSGSYLYFHGLDYAEEHGAQKLMYEEPGLYPEIFSQYGVDYILVSAYERQSYRVDEQTISARFPCVYENGDIRLYAVE